MVVGLNLEIALAVVAATTMDQPDTQPGLKLTWDAPPNCPSDARVRATIKEALENYTPPKPVSAAVLVRHTAAGFELTISLDKDGKHSERTLEGTSCDELSDAAALILVMTVDPRFKGSSLQQSPSPTDGAHEADLQPNSIPEPRPAPAPAPAPRSNRGLEMNSAKPSSSLEERDISTRTEQLRFVSDAQVGLGWGPLPRFGSMVELGLGVGAHLWRAGVIASYWPETQGSSFPDSNRSVRAQLWAMGVQACGEPATKRFSFPLCGGVQAGQMIAHGRGALEAREARSAWVAAHLSTRVVFWALENLGVSLEVSGHVALRRPTFDTRPSRNIVHKANLLGVRASVGLNFRVP